MYSNLPDILLVDGAQQQIAADCQELVGQELSAKSGVSATALKVAYKAVTTFAPGSTWTRMTVPGIGATIVPDSASPWPCSRT